MFNKAIYILPFIVAFTHSVSAQSANEPATGMVLSAEVVLSVDTPLPGGIILPAGTLLPAGTVLPAGTILPLSTPISDDAPADEDVAADVAAEVNDAPEAAAIPPEFKPAPVSEPTLSTTPQRPMVLPKVELKSHAVPALTVPTESAEPEPAAASADEQPSASDDAVDAVGDDADAAKGVPYLSGGIGTSEREEMLQMKANYNLHLLFAEQGSGAYLADIRVRIADMTGTTLLAAVSKGPWFYAKLAPGQYRLSVDKAGRTQSRDVRLPANAALQVAFYWSLPLSD